MKNSTHLLMTTSWWVKNDFSYFKVNQHNSDCCFGFDDIQKQGQKQYPGDNPVFGFCCDFYR